MREKLAIARAKSRMDICASEAFADPLGLALLRAIDNGDGGCLRQSQALLLAKLRRRHCVAYGRAIVVVRQVLIYLHDQRCRLCAGHRYMLEETHVRLCHECGGTGFANGYPPKWGRAHQSVLADSLEAMGRALHQARRGFD